MLVLLIDGLNLLRRIHAAVPDDDGSPAHAEGLLNSSVRSLSRALGETGPSHAVCVLDGGGESWRHRLAPGYKADRPAMPESLARVMPEIEAAFAALHVRSVRVPGLEADDVLATMAVKIAVHGGASVILSTDKSMLTLLGPRVRVRNHFDGRDLDAAYVRERFGVPPARLVTYLALVGDRSQGIPGVRGVGAKSAAQLLGEHEDLEAVLAHATGDGRIERALREGADDARLSLALVRLRTDVEVGVNLSECRIPSASAAG